MTTRIAIFLGLLILAGIGYDWAVTDLSGTLFLARKLMDLIEYLAFWR